VLTAIGATAVAALLASPLDLPTAVLALPLATSSAAIVLPLLNEHRATGDQALLVLAWVTVADVVTILVLPMALARDNAPKIALGSLVVSALAVALLLTARAASGRREVAYVRRMSRRYEWALDLRISLLLLATLAYVAERTSTSILVAGFATGLVVAAIGEPRRLTRQVRGIAHGFFIPLFFVTLGARLDVHGLHVAQAALLVVAATAIHVVVARLMRQPLAVGLTATATLGVPAAVVELGLANGRIDAGQGATLIAAALASIGVAAVGVARLPARAPDEPEAPQPATGTRVPAP
jgi:Kef-type K+ transport system membrane component KefB